MNKRSARRGGFSLVELLIVLSIIALLMGLLMPAISIIRNNAMRANTENLLRKVDTALHGFKVDARAFPYAAGPQDPIGPWTNLLGYRLNHTLTENEFKAFTRDLNAVQNAYLPGGSHCIVMDHVDLPRNAIFHTDNTGNQEEKDVQKFGEGEREILASAANRLGSERAAVGIMCGNIKIKGTQPGGAGSPWKDRASPILASPQSLGWTSEYLKGQLQKNEMRLDADGIPQAIIDRYGRELVYVNPVVAGVNGFSHQHVGGLVDPLWFNFQTKYRTATATMDSDIRTTAALEHVADFELWSAGRDGRFHAQRNHPDNRDNISIVRYNKGLK